MTTLSIEPRKLATQLALATGGSLLVLAALFYAVSFSSGDASPARLLEVLKSSSWFFFGVYAVTMLAGVVVRAWRYTVLLKASGEQAIPDFKNMSLITAVRGMTVDLLPARLGELVFVFLLNRDAGTKVSSGLTTLLFATLLDILVLAPITIAIGLIAGFPNKTPFLLALIALFIVVVFVFGLRFVFPRVILYFEPLTESSNRVVRSLASLVVSINRAVQTTLKAGVFGQVIGLTFIIRLLKYAGLLLLFYGITRSNFSGLADMGPLTVLGAMIASEMSASLPIPALMSFGSWEVGGMTLLSIAGALPNEALLTMLGIHIQTQAIDYGVGISALAALLLLGRRIREQGVNGDTGRGVCWGCALAFTVFAAVLVYFGMQSMKRQNEVNVADVDAAAALSPEQRPAWFRDLKGMVVWSSNRFGNHDILKMTLPDQKITRLTTDKHTETYPRISPDGKKLVFVRSHKEWQSQRDVKPWDVWLKDLQTGEEKLLAKWGTAPDWSPDGKTIYFQRSPNQIIAYDLVSGKEAVFMESGKDQNMRTAVELYNPSVNQKGEMSFFFRNHGQPTNVIRKTDGKVDIVHREGCQITWSPSGKYVFYVAHGGKQINLFKRYFPDSGKAAPWLDLPGDFSHEYFPRLTQDEKYLVFGASKGGHEHDMADYEIFLWEVNSDPAQAQRLTFNKANDSWPDIWIK